MQESETTGLATEISDQPR